jgi:hypothetical protein
MVLNNYPLIEVVVAGNIYRSESANPMFAYVDATDGFYLLLDAVQTVLAESFFVSI